MVSLSETTVVLVFDGVEEELVVRRADSIKNSLQHVQTQHQGKRLTVLFGGEALELEDTWEGQGVGDGGKVQIVGESLLHFDEELKAKDITIHGEDAMEASRPGNKTYQHTVMSTPIAAIGENTEVEVEVLEVGSPSISVGVFAGAH